MASSARVDAPGQTLRPPYFRPFSSESDLRSRVQHRLLHDLGPGVVLNPDDERQLNGMRAMIVRCLDAVLGEDRAILEGEALERLRQQLFDEFLGYGPLQSLLDDPSISEIITIGHEKVFITRGGRRERVDPGLESDAHLQHIINRMLAPHNQTLNTDKPMVNARLADGSRLSVIIPPLSAEGTVLSIHKLGERLPLTDQNLIDHKMATAKMLTFLRACVQVGLNILISGRRGVGRTTLLNALLTSISPDQITVIIEHCPELHPPSDLAIQLQARSSPDGRGSIGEQQLLEQAFEMGADRIVIGEIRSGVEQLVKMALLGYSWMGTVFGRNPADALSLLQAMILASTHSMQSPVIMSRLTASVDLIVHLERLGDGSRRITHITEVQGMEGGRPKLVDLFRFESMGFDKKSGQPVGRHRPTGWQPLCLARIAASGVKLPPGTFGSSHIGQT